MDALMKLAPFCRKAGIVVTGRERMARLGGKLGFVVITRDLSANSRKEALQRYACPIAEWGTPAEMKALFGLDNAKIVGFLAHPLSKKLFEDFKPFVIAREMLPSRPGRAAARPEEPAGK